MIDRALTLAGVAVLLLAWAGPLPGMVAGSFAAHMTLHMVVVGIGVPLLAAGIGPLVAGRNWPGSRLALPIAVSVLDLVVVWGWHAPALHHASRSQPWALAAEQASFVIVSLLVWLVALGSTSQTRQSAALAGAMALFFTSMHMTLLGALIGLAPRVIYDGHSHHAVGLPALADQQLGGVIMLGIGGAIYLAGGLVLMARVLQRRATT